MRFAFTKFTLQTSFKTLLLGGRGLVKSVVEVTVDSKEGNSEDFSPNCVQEFGLCIAWREAGGGGRSSFESNMIRLEISCMAGKIK